MWPLTKREEQAAREANRQYSGIGGAVLEAWVAGFVGKRKRYMRGSAAEYFYCKGREYAKLCCRLRGRVWLCCK